MRVCRSSKRRSSELRVLLLISFPNWIAIGIILACLIVFLLYDFYFFIPGQRISLHSIPHAVSFVVNVVDAIPVHFGACVNNLPRSNPLLVVFLRCDECLNVLNFTEVVELKGILSVDFLSKGKSELVAIDMKLDLPLHWPMRLSLKKLAKSLISRLYSVPSLF